MRKGTYKTTIDGVPVTVHYSTYPAMPGARDGRGGPPLEPDDPAHCEIDWIERPHGRMTLTIAQLAHIEEEIGEYLSGEE